MTFNGTITCHSEVGDRLLKVPIRGPEYLPLAEISADVIDCRSLWTPLLPVVMVAILLNLQSVRILQVR